MRVVSETRQMSEWSWTAGLHATDAVVTDKGAWRDTNTNDGVLFIATGLELGVHRSSPPQLECLECLSCLDDGRDWDLGVVRVLFTLHP